MDLNQVLSLFTSGPVERRGTFQRVALLDGSTYLGDVASGRRHGVGFMTWPDGLRYLGEWVDNAATGEGILLWPDGAEYYGQVERGKRHGRGLYIDASGHYAGEWRAGLRHGLGTQVAADATYCGEWADGARWGWGNMSFASGNHYEGLWRADAMEGYGSMTWVTAAKSRVAADQQQHSEAPSGVASLGATAASLHGTVATLLGSEDTTVDMARTITFNVGALTPGPLGPFNPSIASTEAVYEKYVGTWHNGMPHGSGEYALFFHDGAARDNPFQTINHFVGHFRRGMRHGKGTQLYADGRVFEGEWADNIKIGHGFLTMADGARSSVIVKDDVIVPDVSPLPSTRGGGTASGSGSGAGSPRGGANSGGVLKDTNTSTEDALQIGDLASEKEVAEIKGLVTNYKPLLKHLYTAYATIPPMVGYYGAIEQLLSADDDVPNPAFLTHPVAAAIPPLQGITRDRRNKRLCQRACEAIHAEAMRNANGIACRFSRAADAMGEGSAFGRGLLAALGEEQHSLASEAFAVTYAALPLANGREQQLFRSHIDVTMPAAAPNADRRPLQNALTRSQFLQLLDDARVLDTSLPASRVNTLLAPALSRDPNRTITPPKPMRAMLRAIDKSTDQISFGVFVEALVRVAEGRMVTEGPWFASCVLNGLSLTHRVQLFCDYYIVPLGTALQAMAAGDALRPLGIEPFFATSSGNQTIAELKRAAARTLQNMRDKAKGSAARAGVSVPSAASQPPQAPAGGVVGGAGGVAASIATPNTAASSSAASTGMGLGAGAGGAPPMAPLDEDPNIAGVIGAALDEASPALYVSTIVKRQPIRVDGTPNAIAQLWTVECLDTGTHRAVRHCVIVHCGEEGNTLGFGGVVLQRSREDFAECLALSCGGLSASPSAAAPFVLTIGGSAPTTSGETNNSGVSGADSDGAGEHRDASPSPIPSLATARGRHHSIAATAAAAANGLLLDASPNPSSYGSHLPQAAAPEDAALYAVPVAAEVLMRVPSVAQHIERQLLLLIRVFESLQRDTIGLCRLSDVFSVLLLSGFAKEKKKRIIKTVIESKPKPPPPPPTGKEKGRSASSAQRAAAGGAAPAAGAAGGAGAAGSPQQQRRPSTPSKGGKVNKKQQQLQQALEAEAALRKKEEEQQRAREAALRMADGLPPADGLDPLPKAEVSLVDVFRSVLVASYHTVLGAGAFSSFPHRVPFDPSATIAAIAEANSPVTRQFCRVSPVLEEVIQLQRMAAKGAEDRCAKARPVPTPVGTSQALLLGETVLLTFNDFIAVLINAFLAAFRSRTPLQAIKAGMLYLPKMRSVMATLRGAPVAAIAPPFIDTDAPLPVRMKPVPEDTKAKKR